MNKILKKMVLLLLIVSTSFLIIIYMLVLNPILLIFLPASTRNKGMSLILYLINSRLLLQISVMAIVSWILYWINHLLTSKISVKHTQNNLKFSTQPSCKCGGELISKKIKLKIKGKSIGKFNGKICKGCGAEYFTEDVLKQIKGDKR